ncbi:MAG: hypothetical protein PWP23_3059 [Candidatus Sumerlaeota bacterium]|nr:hypothetical protein [Candidatus Sumerlaeota bacterium]
MKLRLFGKKRRRNADPQARRMRSAALLCFALFFLIPLTWLEYKARTVGALGEPGRPQGRELESLLDYPMPEVAETTHRLRLAARASLPAVCAMAFVPAEDANGTPRLALLGNTEIVLLGDGGTSQTFALPAYQPPDPSETDAEVPESDALFGTPRPRAPGAWPWLTEPCFDSFRTPDGQLHFVALLGDPPTIVRFTPENDSVAVLQGAVASPPDDEMAANGMMMRGMMGNFGRESALRVMDDGEGNPLLLFFGAKGGFPSRSSLQIFDANLQLLWSPVLDERFPSDVLTVVGPVRFPEHGTGLIVVSSASMQQNVQRYFLPFSDPAARVTVPGPVNDPLANLPFHPYSTLGAPASEMAPYAVWFNNFHRQSVNAYAAPGSPAVPSPMLRQYPFGFLLHQAFHSVAPNGNSWMMQFEIVDQQGKRVANAQTLRSALMQYQNVLGIPREEDVAWIQINYGARILEWNGQTFSLEAPGSEGGARLFDGTREISDAELFVLPGGVLFAIEISGGRMSEVLLYRLEPLEAAR